MRQNKRAYVEDETMTRFPISARYLIIFKQGIFYERR